MRIIKAPLRISLWGGGTDLPEYYEKHGSTIISMAINKYMYLVHNPRPTGGYRLSYSVTEELSTLTTAKHTIIRQAAMDYGGLEPCTLTIVSDVPKGTGLGSSSALAVCIHKLFCPNYPGHAPEIAHAAYELECQVSNCGVQDHLPPTFGGFNVYTIGRDGKATAKAMPQKYSDMVDRCGLLLYTGLTRPADAILKTWKKSTGHLRRLQELAIYVKAQIQNDDLGLATFAGLLHTAWELKRVIGGVGNSALFAQYDRARDAGAMGGKLLGAGGGGCWFFLVSPESRQNVIDALGLVEIPIKIEQRGSSDCYF
jgi:D-glycero-alpha-D-manno-heptose-7-phosphate kinase